MSISAAYLPKSALSPSEGSVCYVVCKLWSQHTFLMGQLKDVNVGRHDRLTVLVTMTHPLLSKDIDLIELARL